MNTCERHGRIRCGECAYIEQLEEDRDKLIEGLRIATDVLGTVPMNDARLWGVYNKLCDILKEIGVTDV